MNEVDTWKSIVGYEGTYEVSFLGVRRISTGRILKPRISQGRLSVSLCLCGKQTTHMVSHLVADAFLAPKKPTDQVLRHLNDNPADNRIENLAWGTRSDNAQDSIRNEKMAKGIANGRAKLTEDDVREIRCLCAAGNFTLKELALRFGVSFATIHKIVQRKIWRHVV